MAMGILDQEGDFVVVVAQGRNVAVFGPVKELVTRPLGLALESGQQDAYRYLLKPVDYEELIDAISSAYDKKVEMQTVKFREQVEEISRSGIAPDSGGALISTPVVPLRISACRIRLLELLPER